MRLNLFLICLCTLFIIVVSGFEPLSRKQKKINHAISSYQKAMSQTRLLLANRMHLVHKEPLVQAHMKKQRIHSLKNFIKGFITTGEVDSLEVRKKGLDARIFAGKKRNLKGINFKSKKNSFYFWLSDSLTNTPILGLAVPIATRGMWLIGTVDIGTYWWERYPSLSRSRSSLKTIVEKNQGNSYPLFLEDPSSPKDSIGFMTTSWTTAYLPKFFPLLRIYSEMITLLVFLIILLFWWKTSKLQNFLRTNSLQHDYFQDWLSKWINSDNDPDQNPDTLGKYQSFALQLQKNRQRNNQDKIEMQSKIDRYQVKIDEMQAENARAKSILQTNKVSQLSWDFNGSLQQKACEKTTIAQNKLETMQDIINVGLVPANNSLFQLISHWHRSLSTKSPRKFIRSLAETPKKDSNELVAQLQTILHCVSQISNYVVNLRLQHLQSQKNLTVAWQLQKAQSFLNPIIENSDCLVTDIFKNTSRIIAGAFPNLRCEWKLPNQTLLVSVPPNFLQIAILASIDCLQQESLNKLMTMNVQSQVKKGDCYIVILASMKESNLDANRRVHHRIENINSLLSSYGGNAIYIPEVESKCSVTLNIPLTETIAKTNLSHKQSPRQSHPQSQC